MEKIGKISALVVVAMIVISMIASTAIAYDADNPWTGTVVWSIPSDTSFIVTFAGSQTQINFTASSATQSLIEPDGQDAANNTPIISIENTGNTNLTLKINLTSTKPSWATIKGGVLPSHNSAVEFNDGSSPLTLNVDVGLTAPLYLWTNITNATAGDTTRELMIRVA